MTRKILNFAADFVASNEKFVLYVQGDQPFRWMMEHLSNYVICLGKEVLATPNEFLLKTGVVVEMWWKCTVIYKDFSSPTLVNESTFCFENLQFWL